MKTCLDDIAYGTRGTRTITATTEQQGYALAVATLVKELLGDEIRRMVEILTIQFHHTTSASMHENLCFKLKIVMCYQMMGSHKMEVENNYPLEDLRRPDLFPSSQTSLKANQRTFASSFVSAVLRQMEFTQRQIEGESAEFDLAVASLKQQIPTLV